MDATRIERSRVTELALVVAAAAGAIWPGVVAWRRGNENVAAVAEREHRRASALPTLPNDLSGVDDFGAAFGTWFRDAFGSRTALVRAGALAKLATFGAAPADRWRIGPNGWVFTDDDDAIASAMGLAPLGARRLAAWQRALEQRRDWLAARGIEHVVVYVPHKATIYPEELPTPLARRGESRREELLRHLRSNTTLRVVDVAPALLAEKARDRSDRHVYAPHGLHWTPIGELVAANEVLRALPDLFPDARPRTLEDYRWEELPVQADSWDRRMYLEGALVQHEGHLLPLAEGDVRRIELPPGSSDKDQALTRDAAGPHVLVVHDSFGPGVARHLADHASRVDARWRGFLEGKLVETLRPDVVIEVYSELALVSQRPARLAAFVGERELVEYRSATALHTAVPSGRAPALEPGFDDASFEALTEGGWRIGAGPARVLVRLELPEPLAEGDELLVGFDVTAPKPSLVAAYHGVEPWRLPGGFPEVRDLAPIELKAGRQQVVVPLAADPRATAVWLLVPPKAGPFDVHALDVRSATATSPEGAPR